MIGSTSGINGAYNLFGVQKSASSRENAAASGTSPTAVSDMLTFSPTANMLREFLSMDVTAEGDRGENDLTGLEQLKQRGDMLVNILQMKLKNFESSLITSMKSAGIDPQSMEMKNDGNGLLLMNEMPNKEAIQNLLNQNGSLRDQFQDISRTAGLLEMLQQVGTYTGAISKGAAGIPAQYAQQSRPLPAEEKRPDAEFVLRVMEGNASYAFE